MKKLLIGLFMLTSVSVSAQYATYTPLPTPTIQLNGQPQVQQVRPTVREQPKEQVYRTIGYYENLSGEVSRVSLKFTVKEVPTGESLSVVAYNIGKTWISTNLFVSQTGYGDPKDFDYKVGIARVGTVYFNY